MNGNGEDAQSVRLYQSFERFQQFDDNHVDFAEKIAKLGSAPPKSTGPKSGQWNVAVHVPFKDKNVKPKKAAPKQEVKRWKDRDGNTHAGARRGSEHVPVVKARAPAAQVIKIHNKLAHRYTAQLAPETTMRQAQVHRKLRVVAKHVALAYFCGSPR